MGKNPIFIATELTGAETQQRRLKGTEFTPEIQSLLAQASIAAQATAQMASQQAPVNVAIRMVNMLMWQRLISQSSMGSLEHWLISLKGEPNQQLEGSNLDKNSARSIQQMLIGRTSVAIRREMGILMTRSWPERVRKLKEGYGGARKSYQRILVSLLLTGRAKGESPSGYAQSIKPQTRAICDKVIETEKDKTKARYNVELKKELLEERILKEIPERIEKSLKSTIASLRLEVVVNMVKEEDGDFL
ncbi:hypothetical protein AAG570_011828 [Ranatra chinensis]|uniref:Uncharacterized protein n=1 Tax=Ranatra chinensis TaxID=642074 RepID=A0ABD0YVH2_9HEMI